MSSASGVYVKDKTYGWLPATISSSDAKTAQVVVQIPSGVDKIDVPVEKERKVNLTDYEDNALPLQNIDEGGNAIIVPDMCDLHSLHEAAILYNLMARHIDQKPYTRVGDIVIAMNPFQWINDLYSKSKRDLYTENLVYNVNTSGDSKSGLEPHIYEVSSLAYRGLALDSHHQSILVSGESGSGKTETVKLIMTHLASVHKHDHLGDDDNTSGVGVSDDNIIVKRVLDSNPLLEAFGNAKTVRNDNSSRFGKYMELQFDVEDATTAAIEGKAIPSCMLAGSKCSTYLLEKSRVVAHEASERTYHIFYQLLAAPDSAKSDIWDGLLGSGNASFNYVGDTDTKTIENCSDGDKWQTTVDALALINVSGDTFKYLMRAICTVLQLGNLSFGVDPENDDRSVITSDAELLKLSSLMGIEKATIEKALTFRTLNMNKEKVSVPLRAGNAKDGCDAFAKAIYQNIFDWLVRQINTATCAEMNYGEASNIDQWGNIGLLDIFGFETFEVNRFEQWSINYCNEKLQAKYNLDVFSAVMDEYTYEGIEMPEVEFSDNSEVLNLVEGRMGMINMLNEECLRPHGNDSSFVAKVKTVNKDIECLSSNPLHTKTEFGILHYAGPVIYDATNFVQKNNDKLPQDLIDCAVQSSNKLIGSEFKPMEESTLSRPGPGTGRSKHSSSVSSKFRSQLHNLMLTIGETRSRYVRCIKPNPEKLPIKIDLLSTVQQLRCAGVVAAVTISRVSYPNRLTHQTALERFSCLFPDSPDESKSEENGDNLGSSIEQILSDFKKDNTSDLFAIGKSRIYFRAGALEFLELQRMKKLGELATAIQTCARGFLAISAFHALRNKCIFIQSLARRNKARKELLQACAAVTLLACWIRQINSRRELEALRREKASTLIQNRYRIMSARMVLRNSLCGAIYIQKIWRGALQRPKYPIMLAEAKEEARVNSKIAALQKRLADAEMKLIRADKERVLYENGGRVDPQPIESSEEKKDDGDDDRNQSLIHESTEMIESLRKENFQLKTSSYLLKSDLNSLKSSYGELSEHYASLQHSFNALKKHSANLSNTTMKSNVSALLHKKDIGNAKKAMKQQKQEHKTDIAKLKSLMKAKDLDNESEIARLQALVESLSKNKRHSSHRRSSKSTIDIDSSRHSDRNRGSKNLRVNTKTRAKFTDDDSPRNQYAQITPGSDKWGNDGFFTMHGKEKSPTNSLNSGRNSIPRHRNSRTKKKNNRSVSTSSAVPNQITTITRELSTSSLQGALKKSSQSTSKVAPSTKNISPRSSLSSAVSKQSSLAQRAGNNKQ